MKFGLFIVFSFFCVVSCFSEDLPAKENANVWLKDLDKAKEVSKSEKKKILMVFSGSDWCIACIKLNRLVLSKEEFLSRAKKDYVLLNVDFPSKKENALSPEHQKKNDALAEQYNPKGFFPMVIVLDSEGKVLHTVEKYQGESIESYYDKLNSSKGSK